MKRNLLTIFIACLLLISVIHMANGFPKRILTTLGIYSGDDVAYSPDGRLLALVRFKLIFLLDAETLTQVGTLIQSSIPYGFRDSINTTVRDGNPTLRVVDGLRPVQRSPSRPVSGIKMNFTKQ